MENNHGLPFLYAKIKLEVVTVKKGQTRRIWTPEQKAEIVHKHLKEHISVRTLEKEYQADRSMICRWVKKYIKECLIFFDSFTEPGVIFATRKINSAPAIFRRHCNVR